MAPMRGDRCGSPARASLPLPRRLIRQIARHVASSGRSLRRLEVSGRVIENFDDIESEDDDRNTPIIASACGASSGNLPPPEHDDDLTSLSWLQDKNLLRGTLGINLTKSDEMQQYEENEMSDSHVTVKTEEPSSTTPPPLQTVPSPPRTPCKAPPPSPPICHPLTKPPYSFSSLIFMAIEAAPTRALPVKEIYAWIIQHFPYFKTAPQGWKNSVRHNLSLNKCFHKVAAAPGLGKGSLWTVDPQHRVTLLQAFGRQPGSGGHSGWRSVSPSRNHRGAGPDPQLFPFLARRLAGEVNTPSSSPSNPNSPSPWNPSSPSNPPSPIEFPVDSSAPGAEEYIAAATVLAMKYGHSVLDQLPPAAHLVISRCTRDEHSYTGGAERRTAEALLDLASAGATS